MSKLKVALEIHCSGLAIMAGHFIDGEMYPIYFQTYSSYYIKNFQIVDQRFAEEIKSYLSELEKKIHSSEYDLILVLPNVNLDFFKCEARVNLPQGLVSFDDIKLLKHAAITNFNDQSREVVEIIIDNYQLRSRNSSTLSYLEAPIGIPSEELSGNGIYVAMDKELAHSYVNALSAKNIPLSSVIVAANCYRHYYLGLVLVDNYIIINSDYYHNSITFIINNQLLAVKEFKIGIAHIDELIAKTFDLSISIASNLRSLYFDFQPTSQIIYRRKENDKELIITQEELSLVVLKVLHLIVKEIENTIISVIGNREIAIYGQGMLFDINNFCQFYTTTSKRVISTIRPSMIGARKFEAIALIGAIIANK